MKIHIATAFFWTYLKDAMEKSEMDIYTSDGEGMRRSCFESLSSRNISIHGGVHCP